MESQPNLLIEPRSYIGETDCRRAAQRRIRGRLLAPFLSHSPPIPLLRESNIRTRAAVAPIAIIARVDSSVWALTGHEGCTSSLPTVA